MRRREVVYEDPTTQPSTRARYPSAIEPSLWAHSLSPSCSQSHRDRGGHFLSLHIKEEASTCIHAVPPLQLLPWAHPPTLPA